MRSSSSMSSKSTRSVLSASATRPAICQKWGSSSRAVGPSAWESTTPMRSARMRKPPLPEDLPRVVADPLEVVLAIDEDVRDREGRVERQRRVVAAGANLLRPDLARDVDEDPAAVALAVDVAGAVKHLLEVRERQGHRLAARRRVLADRRVDAAGVLVLHARRRDARLPGKLRRVAKRLGGAIGARSVRCLPRRGLRARGTYGRAGGTCDLPGSVPSSSGHATGKRTAGSIKRQPDAPYSLPNHQGTPAPPRPAADVCTFVGLQPTSVHFEPRRRRRSRADRLAATAHHLRPRDPDAPARHGPRAAPGARRPPPSPACCRARPRRPPRRSSGRPASGSRE